MQLLRKLTYPFAVLYALIVHLRNYLYDIKVFKSESFKTPTICVGNLSVGGTGKTPMIELLISALQPDFDTAVLSRGYKRKSNGFILAKQNSSVDELGDEPYQIYQKFPQISMAVDADRRNGIRQLEAIAKPAVILLDDAYQHRKVNPTFSILLTAYSNLYSSDFYLPAGNLRDSKKEARRAQCIVVTKCPNKLSDAEQNQIIMQLKPLAHQQVFFATLDYDKLIKGETTITLEDFGNEKVALVTGIANPKPLLQYLKFKKVNFDHHQFADHHFFTPNEITTFKHYKHILTTEKDYVRLEGKLANLYYIGVKHKFLDEGEQRLMALVKQVI